MRKENNENINSFFKNFLSVFTRKEITFENKYELLFSLSLIWFLCLIVDYSWFVSYIMPKLTLVEEQ